MEEATGTSPQPWVSPPWTAWVALATELGKNEHIEIDKLAERAALFANLPMKID